MLILYVVMCNPTAGTHCGISYGITNEEPRKEFRTLRFTLSFLYMIQYCDFHVRICIREVLGLQGSPASCTEVLFLLTPRKEEEEEEEEEEE